MKTNENTNIIKAIRERRSVRTFDGRPLSDDDRKDILDFATSLKNPYDIPITWQLLSKDDGSVPVINGADTYIAGKMKACRHAEEAFGYSFEELVLFAWSKGICTTWIAGTMDRQAFERAVDLKNDEVMPCISPLGYPATKMSVKESLMRKGVKADERHDFGSLFFEGDLNTAYDKRDGLLANALEMVRLAPSAVNKQPWRLVVDGDKVHFYEKTGTANKKGWDIHKIDMGIAMYHFMAAIKDGGLDARCFIEDPGIKTPKDIVYISSYEILR